MFEKQPAEIHNYGRDHEEPQPSRRPARPHQRVRYAGDNNEQQCQRTFQHRGRDVARIELEWQGHAHTWQSTEADARAVKATKRAVQHRADPAEA